MNAVLVVLLVGIGLYWLAGMADWWWKLWAEYA